MEFKQIEAFVNVVKHRSFSKAGDALYLTQPTISAHISSLEKELGKQLIQRGRKETLPTKEGAIFYEYAVNMLRVRDESLYSLDSGKGEYEGCLDIVISSGICDPEIPRRLMRFRNAFPNIELFVRQEPKAALLKKISDKRAEFGFTESKQDDGLEYELLREDRLVLITPKSRKYFGITDREISLFELRREPLVAWDTTLSSGKPLIKILADSGVSINQRGLVATLDSIDAVKQFVKNDLGVAILPESIAKENPDGNLLVFRITDLFMTNKLYTVYNKAEKLSPEAAAFLAFLHEETPFEEKNIS